MRFEAGSKFAGYTVVSRLGRGGMATVYLVREEGLDRLVALKVLPEQLVDDQQFGPRFEQEARVIGSLDHPHIIPLYRYGITEDVPWMALRYVDGGDFATRLIARPLALAEGFSILRGVASALDYAHRKGVVHRDIKPQNILLTSEGNSYLADFGVAKLLQASNVSHTLIGGIVGSPAYMAPEQAQGHAIGAHTDIYSLAVICFQWMTGSLPFEADTPHAILLKHVLEPLPVEALGLLSPAVAAALQRGMAKRPEDRFPTAGQLIVALEQAMFAPMSTTLDGLPALTPSGLRAVSGMDRRLDTPTTLSRPVVEPVARTETPTTLTRAVVDPAPPAAPRLERWPPPPDVAEPVPAPAWSAPERSIEQAYVPPGTPQTAEPISRVSAMLQALQPAPSRSPPTLTPYAEPPASALTQMRRPLAFVALGAALLIGIYIVGRLLASDPAGSFGEVASTDGGSENATPAGTAPSQDSTESEQQGVSAEAGKQARETLRLERERMAQLGNSSAGEGEVAQAPVAAAGQSREVQLAEALRAASEVEAANRTAQLAEDKRIAAERETERRAAEARIAAAPTKPIVALPLPSAPAVAAPVQAIPDPVIAATPTAVAPSSEATQAAPVAPVTSVAQRPAPAPRIVGGFVDKGGGVLTDSRTGFEWTQADNGSSIDWGSAKRHCSKRGGGWRLPSAGELVQSIDGGGAKSTRCGNSNCRVSKLFDLSSSKFWSSDKAGREFAYVAYLDNGKVQAISVDLGSPRVLCIRKP